MRILLLDIETSPSVAYIWSLWDKYTPIDRLKEHGTILCWSAKWLDDSVVYYSGLDKHSEFEMMQRLHELVAEAHCIVHYNGKRFDIPIINRMWLKLGFPPPPPHKDIDLLETVKRRFRFTSNKLDFVAQYLELGKKAKHSGFDTWVKCLAGDAEAWRTMKAYNVQDVRLLETLYKKMLPWLDRHPSHGAVAGDLVCPKCGGSDYQQRGYAITTSYRYPRYQCKGCGGWFRGSKSVPIDGKIRPVNAAG